MRTFVPWPQTILSSTCLWLLQLLQVSHFSITTFHPWQELTVSLLHLAGAYDKYWSSGVQVDRTSKMLSLSYIFHYLLISVWLFSEHGGVSGCCKFPTAYSPGYQIHQHWPAPAGPLCGAQWRKICHVIWLWSGNGVYKVELWFCCTLQSTTYIASEDTWILKAWDTCLDNMIYI